MSETAFQAGDEFIETLWTGGEHGQIIAIEDKPYTTLYEIKWDSGEITYERADYLRQLEKIEAEDGTDQCEGCGWEQKNCAC